MPSVFYCSNSGKYGVADGTDSCPYCSMPPGSLHFIMKVEKVFYQEPPLAESLEGGA